MFANKPVGCGCMVSQEEFCGLSCPVDKHTLMYICRRNKKRYPEGTNMFVKLIEIEDIYE